MALGRIPDVSRFITIFFPARGAPTGFDTFIFLGCLRGLRIGTSLEGYAVIVIFFSNLSLAISSYFLFLSNSIFVNVITKYISGTYTLY